MAMILCIPDFSILWSILTLPSSLAQQPMLEYLPTTSMSATPARQDGTVIREATLTPTIIPAKSAQPVRSQMAPAAAVAVQVV